MNELLGFVIVSFFTTSFLLIPFIDVLFGLKAGRQKNNAASSEKALNTTTPITNQLLGGKDVNTPVGGGILVIAVVVILTIITVLLTEQRISRTIAVLVLTILMFGGIGFIDDARKILLSFSGKYAGIRGRYLFLMQTFFAVIIATLLFSWIGFNNIFIPIFGNIYLGILYIPLAAFIIVAFANAINISDGLDGLSSGLLTICLFAFLTLAHAVFDQDLATFVGIWIGALIAYLYFNIYPARVYLGDAGAFGFGATLAVIGLLTGKILGLGVIGGVFVIIISSSLLQLASKKILKRKLLPVAPIHMYFKYIGWEEPKIVTRFWLVGAVFAIFGLWLSLIFK